MTWKDVPENKLLESKVKPEDFYKALAKAKSSVSTEDLQRCQEWTTEFGMEGA